jgi:hypothetical protein
MCLLWSVVKFCFSNLPLCARICWGRFGFFTGSATAGWFPALPPQASPLLLSSKSNHLSWWWLMATEKKLLGERFLRTLIRSCQQTCCAKRHWPRPNEATVYAVAPQWGPDVSRHLKISQTVTLLSMYEDRSLVAQNLCNFSIDSSLDEESNGTIRNWIIYEKGD